MTIKKVPGQVLFQKSAGLTIRIVPRGQVEFCVARTELFQTARGIHEACWLISRWEGAPIRLMCFRGLKQRRSAAFQCRRLTGWSDTITTIVPSAYTNRPENWLGAWAWILTGFAGQRLYSRNAPVYRRFRRYCSHKLRPPGLGRSF